MLSTDTLKQTKQNKTHTLITLMIPIFEKLLPMRLTRQRLKINLLLKWNNKKPYSGMQICWLIVQLHHLLELHSLPFPGWLIVETSLSATRTLFLSPHQTLYPAQNTQLVSPSIPLIALYEEHPNISTNPQKEAQVSGTDCGGCEHLSGRVYLMGSPG